MLSDRRETVGRMKPKGTVGRMKHEAMDRSNEGSITRKQPPNVIACGDGLQPADPSDRTANVSNVSGEGLKFALQKSADSEHCSPNKRVRTSVPNRDSRSDSLCLPADRVANESGIVQPEVEASELSNFLTGGWVGRKRSVREPANCEHQPTSVPVKRQRSASSSSQTDVGLRNLKGCLRSASQKVGNASAVKQTRSWTFRSHKIKRTRFTLGEKLSGRKGFVRPQHVSTNIPAESIDEDKELFRAAKDALDTSTACSTPFWGMMEPMFRFVNSEDASFLHQRGGRECNKFASDTSNFTEDCDAVTISAEGDELVTADHLPLSWRLSAAIIDWDDMEISHSDINVEAEMIHNLDSVMKEGFPKSSNVEIESAAAFCTEIPYSEMSFDQRIYLELQRIGLAPEFEPKSSHLGDDLDEEIKRLQDKLCEQTKSNEENINKLMQSVVEDREDHKSDFERIALNKLVLASYAKYQACGGRSYGRRNSSKKLAKKNVSSFIERVLARCRTYEETGKSCFSEPKFKEMFSFNSCASEKGKEAQRGNVLSEPSEAVDKMTNHVGSGASVQDQAGLAGMRILRTKGMRTVRHRNGKARELGWHRIGPSLLEVNVEGEDDRKASPKLKTTQLSDSDGKPLEKDVTSFREPLQMDVGSPMNRDEFDAKDLSMLQLPEVEYIFGLPFDVEGDDLSSWLDIEDENFSSDGLETPMDNIPDFFHLL